MARKIWLGFALLGMLAASCTANAYIDAGETLGVRIGMPLTEAHAIMVRRGLEPGLPQVNDAIPSCGNRRRGPGDQMETFFERSWRQRNYCILAVDGRVAVIGWGDAFL